ncbi:MULTISPECIES: DUF7576 family protein [Natrialbaceae]|uniref:DUF7576 family protein n=1 Tax=Natrialbaceae TaxID=1644061 RepID=UPI00207C5B41|nr:hypothetical protein [Natronococcus sp. CG52]
MTTHGTTNALTRCDQCGDAIETATWHPAVLDRNGERRLLTFCGPACQERWQRRHR